MKKNLQILNKYDMIVLAICIILPVILNLFLIMNMTEGTIISVQYNNDIIASFSIKEEDAYYLILQDGSYQELDAGRTGDLHTMYSGFNVMYIHNGTVTVTDSDCPDSICMHHKQINRVGESIICLPHKLVIEISSSKTDPSDIEPLDGIVH